MRTIRIFSDQPLKVGQSIQLSGKTANYICSVLRMRVDDCLNVFNGLGGAWQGTIEYVSKQMVKVHLNLFITGDLQSDLVIELGQTMSRGDRMDYAIQKVTEAGVTSVTPLWSERCELKLTAERVDKRVKHWQQVAISACEQCGRNIVPKINTPVKLEKWLITRNTEGKFVLHNQSRNRLIDFKTPSSVSVLVGPEGGLTTHEISMAENHGFKSLKLGPRTLRTETAAVIVTALMQNLWGDY